MARAYFCRYILDDVSPCVVLEGEGYRTGARSGMKRSPRTSTSLDAIVGCCFYH